MLKTAFGHNVVSELGKKLLIKQASDLLGMYVGQSEKNIAKMFEQEKKNMPCCYWMKQIVFSGTER